MRTGRYLISREIGLTRTSSSAPRDWKAESSRCLRSQPEGSSCTSAARRRCTFYSPSSDRFFSPSSLHHQRYIQVIRLEIRLNSFAKSYKNQFGVKCALKSGNKKKNLLPTSDERPNKRIISLIGCSLHRGSELAANADRVEGRTTRENMSE